MRVGINHGKHGRHRGFIYDLRFIDLRLRAKLVWRRRPRRRTLYGIGIASSLPRRRGRRRHIGFALPSTHLSTTDYSTLEAERIPLLHCKTSPNAQPSTHNSHPSTHNAQPSTLNPQRTTLNAQHSTLNASITCTHGAYALRCHQRGVRPQAPPMRRRTQPSSLSRGCPPRPPPHACDDHRPLPRRSFRTC